MAVSRFTAAKSADRSTLVMGPNELAGSPSSRAVRPVKWTSPANASVTSAGGAGWLRVPASPARLALARLLALAVAFGADGAAVQAPPASSASTPAAAATTRRITTGPAYDRPGPTLNAWD